MLPFVWGSVGIFLLTRRSAASGIPKFNARFVLKGSKQSYKTAAQSTIPLFPTSSHLLFFHLHRSDPSQDRIQHGNVLITVPWASPNSCYYLLTWLCRWTVFTLKLRLMRSMVIGLSIPFNNGITSCQTARRGTGVI